MVVVVGDHATYHKKYDAPLESDIDALAGSVSGWVHRSTDTADVANDAAQAVAVSRAGAQIATLILPADVSWSDGAQVAAELPVPPATADPMLAPEVAEVLRSGEPTVILVGGDATRRPGLAAATRIAHATGARLLCETFPTRLERGAGVPAIDRLAYFGEAALAQLEGAKHLVLAGAKSPVSFFGYPDKPSDLVPAGCEVHLLAEYTGAAGALIALADELTPGSTAPVAELSRPQLPSGALTAVSVADVVGALMPENVIVVDESNTSSIPLTAATAGAPAHDWLTLTGGAIGYGIPAAVRAAVAAPDRPVLNLESDGYAMYANSGLWTQARENLDVAAVVYNNIAYEIVRLELQRVGSDRRQNQGTDLLDCPAQQWISSRLLKAWVCRRAAATTVEEFADALGCGVRRARRASDRRRRSVNTRLTAASTTQSANELIA